MSARASTLSDRRLSAEVDRLGRWTFAERFPLLAAAVMENTKAREEIDATTGDLMGDQLLKTIRGKWRRRGVPRGDVERLLTGHLIGILQECFTLAAAVAHELVAGAHLAAIEDAAVASIIERREQVKTVRRLCRAYGRWGKTAEVASLDAERAAPGGEA